MKFITFSNAILWIHPNGKTTTIHYGEIKNRIKGIHAK